jgi:hypothetical protein
MKTLIITEDDNGTFQIRPEGDLSVSEIAGMIYHAELLHRLAMIENRQITIKRSENQNAAESTNTATAQPPASDVNVRPPESKKDCFRIELVGLLNRFSKENESNTPDFMLADYLIAALDDFNEITNIRRKWSD